MVTNTVGRSKRSADTHRVPFFGMVLIHVDVKTNIIVIIPVAFTLVANTGKHGLEAFVATCLKRGAVSLHVVDGLAILRTRPLRGCFSTVAVVQTCKG